MLRHGNLFARFGRGGPAASALAAWGAANGAAAASPAAADAPVAVEDKQPVPDPPPAGQLGPDSFGVRIEGFESDLADIPHADMDAANEDDYEEVRSRLQGDSVVTLCMWVLFQRMYDTRKGLLGLAGATLVSDDGARTARVMVGNFGLLHRALWLACPGVQQKHPYKLSKCDLIDRFDTLLSGSMGSRDLHRLSAALGTEECHVVGNGNFCLSAAWVRVVTALFLREKLYRLEELLPRFRDEVTQARPGLPSGVPGVVAFCMDDRANLWDLGLMQLGVPTPAELRAHLAEHAGRPLKVYRYAPHPISAHQLVKNGANLSMVKGGAMLHHPNRRNPAFTDLTPATGFPLWRAALRGVAGVRRYMLGDAATRLLVHHADWFTVDRAAHVLSRAQVVTQYRVDLIDDTPAEQRSRKRTNRGKNSGYNARDVLSSVWYDKPASGRPLKSAPSVLVRDRATGRRRARAVSSLELEAMRHLAMRFMGHKNVPEAERVVNMHEAEALAVGIRRKHAALAERAKRARGPVHASSGSDDSDDDDAGRRRPKKKAKATLRNYEAQLAAVLRASGVVDLTHA